jgi:uncharacterized coiled-coil protein SlyX
MIDKKIIALEEKIAFLQNMVDDLNMTVFRQGENIEKLKLRVKETNEKNLNQNESFSEDSLVIHNKPPHY